MAAARIVGPPGETKRFNAASALSAGDVEVVGNRVGIVSGTKPIAVGDDHTLITAGNIELDAVSGDTWSDGDLLYWDATALNLTDTVGSNKSAGIAVDAKTSGTIRATVDLNASVASTTI